MYVFHKPIAHGAWLERKTAPNGWHGKGGKERDTNPALAPTPKPFSIPGAAKLSLARFLQEALTMTTDLTDDQLTKIWDNCCGASGN